MNSIANSTTKKFLKKELTIFDCIVRLITEYLIIEIDLQCFELYGERENEISELDVSCKSIEFGIQSLDSNDSLG